MQYLTIEEVDEFEKKKMMKKFIDSKNKKAYWNKKEVLAAVAALVLVVNLGVHGGKVLAVATSLKYSKVRKIYLSIFLSLYKVRCEHLLVF